MKKKKDIRDYPLIKTALKELRKDEFRLSSNKRKGKMSFVNLFKNRLEDIEGKRETVSITIYAEVEYVQDKNIELVTKTHGPFAVKMPVNLSKNYIYKFAMYTLFNKGFTLLSAQRIVGIGCRIIKLNKKKFINQKMGSLKLVSYLLNKQRGVKRHGDNLCVLDFVWDQVRGQHGFKTYDYNKLRDELYRYVVEGEMISTGELIKWARECHDNVSIHAFDSRYKKFITHIGSNTRTNVVLVYVVKDGHCFPVTNENLKVTASKANQGGCDNLLKYMTDLKWTRHENVMKLECVDDEVDKENHVVISPEGIKMKDAIYSYTQRESFYLEYMHWNNYNGVLDGFIDHRSNMWLLNEEYDMRKTVCDKLFNTFKTHDFKWTNQSYTSIATSLFSQLNGYIPESSYNVNTRQMLDEFYPRALQWCTTDDIPDDVVNIDISKSYPNILLNNTQPIPLYSIHHVIEPFNCKSDLRKCGEFYIDETVLHNYGTPLKIEAGFYSSNLVFYLVEVLHMPLSQIKYKIITERALKPDTFSNYIKYVFDNLPESEAKKLANSFIGDLGRKYNKLNHGFTCTDYETAMCCWTSSLSEGKKVSIDHHNGLYLIREQKISRVFPDNTSINRFVVSEAILKCLQLIETCHGEESVLYGYNTDGIYISNPNVSFKNKKDVKFRTKHIGKAYITDCELTYFEKHYRENMNVSDYISENGKGCIYNGQAGSGKTHKLCKMVIATENPLVLSFTNKAIENVKSRLISKGYEKEDANKLCHTFDSYFCEWKGRDINSLKDKTIFIEEFSMVPNKWMTKIYEAYTLFNITIYMFGDPNQCEPVEGSSQIHYDYLNSKTVREMCPRIQTLQYIEKSCRYDKQTYDVRQVLKTR